MAVGGWLRSLGLGQYEALFRANEIDADIVPEQRVLVDRLSQQSQSSAICHSGTRPGVGGPLEPTKSNPAQSTIEDSSLRC